MPPQGAAEVVREGGEAAAVLGGAAHVGGDIGGDGGCGPRGHAVGANSSANGREVIEGGGGGNDGGMVWLLGKGLGKALTFSADAVKRLAGKGKRLGRVTDELGGGVVRLAWLIEAIAEAMLEAELAT